MGKAPAEEGAEERNRQEETDSCSYCQYKHHVRYGGCLPCKDLQVRFRNRYYRADDDTGHDDDREALGLCQLCPYLFTDGHHGHIHPQGKKSHTYNQERRAGQEQHQWIQRDGCNRNTKNQYDTGNGQHR